MSTSTNTGTNPYCTTGFTVVGNPAATAITSSPGRSASSPSFGEVNAASASKLADEPEFVVTAQRTSRNSASLRSKLVLNRPVVSQKSSAASTALQTSSSPNTLPEGGITDSPGTNLRGACRCLVYSVTSSMICWRSSSCVIGSHPARTKPSQLQRPQILRSLLTYTAQSVSNCAHSYPHRSNNPDTTPPCAPASHPSSTSAPNQAACGPSSNPASANAPHGHAPNRRNTT